ncbi:peptidase M1-like protein [Lacibacter cauensis]|uniref:Peptidase M1-like protein n=1 Tax=Lacibacter cauensis TaxID=510947 RepID=A0A562SWZ9_9BACT|nr:peptidase M1-like protein [Lacibacter cauensis]
MRTIAVFDINSYFKQIPTYFIAVLLFCFGVFGGSRFNLSVGEGVYLNSPYTIGFMLGLLSLSVIFIATVNGIQLLFKEWDSRFDLLLFSTTISRNQFTNGRFLSFYIVTISGFFLLTAGFMVGQSLREGPAIQDCFYLSYYLYPLVLFGCVNTFFVCSVLCMVAWLTKNKLMVALSGLLLYVLYMVALLFSGSPFMTQSMPQSLEIQRISAFADPFGLTAYFFVSKDFTIAQRNTVLTPLSGSLLANRLMITSMSVVFFQLARKYYTNIKSSRSKRQEEGRFTDTAVSAAYKTTAVSFSSLQYLKAVRSFFKADLIYIFKGIAVAAAAVLLLFNLGMEMYADIEKGIRLPQKFASSGLLSSTILENLHLPAVLLIVYYANDLYWKSSVSRFSILENTTAFMSAKLLGHWFSCIVLIIFFTVISILLGLFFQMGYRFTTVNWEPYSSIFLFCSFPLVVLAGFMLLLNQIIPHKYLSLGVTLSIAFFAASPFTGLIINNPLFRFLTAFRGQYSDFNGYGTYMLSYAQRAMFGLCSLLVFWQISNMIKERKMKVHFLILFIFLVFSSFFFANQFLKGYVPADKRQKLEMAVSYEKKYRKYQAIPQPVITDVITQVHLFPSLQQYTVEGVYTIRNKSNRPVNHILVSFHDDLKITEAQFTSASETLEIDQPISEIYLRQPLRPNDSAKLRFSLQYSWRPVNGHQSFNAIVENGSFMRISRYYPRIGYQSDYELMDSIERKQYGLGPATPLKRIQDPREPADDLITLAMTIDTDDGQTAVGIGELKKKWSDKGRNYFQFEAMDPIPFRFAVSSAAYKIKSVLHDSITISVLYHPEHEVNVDHLIRNAKLTLDYCRSNFGAYPFKSVCFAEVSSFTKGFAGTAYPASIFMTEDMLFHANIKADQKQDVINELAGHELSHLWWGGNQIVPDIREGAAFLTETLAMYTEMMLYKKMYGIEKMKERLQVHQQIYDTEKGFSSNEPLYKVSGGNPHICYSKGAVVMVQLSELIGEQTVNMALRNFLQSVRYSGNKPISTDFINEVLKVSEQRFHSQIKQLFMEV